MHLIETYALNCKSKIDRPKIREDFFPLPIGDAKYITINTEGGMAAKNYGYFSDAISMVLPYLKKLGIHIVQLGNANERPLNGCVNLLGVTSANQSAYIIKSENCLMHVGVDSFLVHLADSYNKKIVSLYSVSPPEVCGPFFGDAKNRVCLTPNFPTNYKYSYNPQETPPQVNTIKPEDIAKAILDLLSIDHEPLPDTVHIGDKYQMQILECVPDQIISPEAFPSALLHVRYDYASGDAAESMLYNQIAARKCGIVTDRPLNIDALKSLRPNIDKMVVEIKDESMAPFARALRGAAIQFILITYLNKFDVAKLKLPYSEYGIIFRQEKKRLEDIKNHALITRESMVRTNKFLLSKQKIYACKADWALGRTLESFAANAFPVGDMLSDANFWAEQDFYYIFNK